MHSVSYTLSLRVTHPTIKAQVISEALSLKPKIALNVGDLRENPPGRLLGGVHKATFCVFKLIEKQAGFFTDGINQVLPLLTKHREFLISVADTGGEAELYIGVFADTDTTGFTMKAEMMAALVDIRIQLSVELYYD